MSPGTEAKQNEDLADALTTVSVLAKRLAKKIRESKEDSDVQELQTDGKDRQSQKECTGDDGNGPLG